MKFLFQRSTNLIRTDVQETERVMPVLQAVHGTETKMLPFWYHWNVCHRLCCRWQNFHQDCYFDNYRCRQWRNFRQNDDISVSVCKAKNMDAAFFFFFLCGHFIILCEFTWLIHPYFSALRYGCWIAQHQWNIPSWWWLNIWWRHQMETFSALLALCAGNSPVIGEFPAQRPVTLNFDVLVDLRLNKRLSKQSTPVIWHTIALITTSL